MQRADGAARVTFARRGAATVLAELAQRVPCRVLFPVVDEGDPVQAVLLTTSGGLTGGDHVAVAAAVGAEACATVTTLAAEKLYRSTGADCRIHVDLSVAEGGWLEWLPQETIMFDGARLRRRVEARVAASGRLLAAEIMMFGRAASGETLNRGLLQDGWAVRRDDRLLWLDAIRLDGDLAAARRRPFGFGNAAGYGTVIYVGPDAEAAADRVRPHDVSVINGVMVVRVLDEDGARLRGAVGDVITRLRSGMRGLPARLPRVWAL